MGDGPSSRAVLEAAFPVTGTASATRLYDRTRDRAYPKPRLRGWLHVGSFAAATVLGVLLLQRVHGTAHAIDAAVFATAVTALFGTSALYHVGHWVGAASLRLQRLDHLMIILLIAGTATVPIQVSVPRPWNAAGLIVLWTMAATAIGFRLARTAAPERLVGAIYLGLGWVAGAAIPFVWMHDGVAPGVLSIAGGVLYSLGALGYHRRAPDPFPAVFGYHEVFHTYVTAAAACHYVAIACFLL